VTTRKAARPRHSIDGVEARGVDGIAGHVSAVATAPVQLTQAIRADLIGSDCCSALGINGRGHSPVLGLCPKLIEAGYDPATPLKVYRGETLSLRIRSIGEAARLRVATHGVGFEPLPECTGGSPVRQIEDTSMWLTAHERSPAYSRRPHLYGAQTGLA
jgi:hypothetical protein